MSRKLFILPIFLCLGILIGCMNLGNVNATYYGEEPYYEDGFLYVEFLEDGTFLIPEDVTTVEVLIVGGGGAGGVGAYSVGSGNYGGGGGGGAGGLLLLDDEDSYEFNATELSNGYVYVTIGAGGTANTYSNAGTNGGNSSFGSEIAYGGGYGGFGYSTRYNGNNGGSGGGGCAHYTATPGTLGGNGIVGQGYDGGDTIQDSTNRDGGAGGGGAGGVGGNQIGTTTAGAGGPGLTVWGSCYAGGGGGGGGSTQASATCGGGSGDGDLTATAGTANTGGGGGGRDTPTSSDLGLNGGSGIVIVRYEISEAPEFINPVEDSTVEDLKVSIAWEDLDDVDYYELKWDDNASMSSPSTGNYTDNYTVLYLGNGDWYLDIKAYFDDGNVSLWYTDVNEPYHFEKDDAPVFSSPGALETSPYTDFEWSEIGEITGYDLRVYTDAGLTTLEYNASNWLSSFPLEVALDEDEYWAIVRGVDDWYNGSWSDTLNFTVDLDEIDFNFTPNTINIYGGDTLSYTFTDMDVNSTYTFKVNRVDDDGVFIQTLSTEIVESDVNGSGSFSYTLPAAAKYPFEVRLNENNARLMYHYAAPKPSNLYNYVAGGHREKYSDVVLAVGIGDVVYNVQSGLLHNRYLTEQSLYEEGDYFLMHYNFPDCDDYNGTSFLIYIMDLYTGDVVAQISTQDLFDYNLGGEYAARNFVIISTNGIKPTIIDSDTLISFTGTNWTTLNVPKGAYDYALVEIDPDIWENVAFGESVLLVGDNADYEWLVEPSSISLSEGQKITWTISTNTEEIWNSYNQMRFYDLSSGVYYIGTTGSPYYETYPNGYSSTFTVAYDTVFETGSAGGSVFGVKPENTNFEYLLDEDDVWQNTQSYVYVINNAITITEVADATDTVDDWLIDLGLGSEQTKLIIAMAMIILVIVGCALIGVPVAGMGIIALCAFVAFIALGFIPIWTIIIIVIALILLLLRMFNGGGGGDE